MTEAPTGDFAPLHAAMKRYVDANLLPGLSGAVLVGREVVDQHCVGWADVENGVPLQTDSLFRVFSNTKLVTSCAVMLLVEEGRLALDDPIERYLPQLGERRVLRPGATRIDDTEPAVRSITVRHLLSHSSGLSYGLLDPGTPIFQAYTAAQVLSAKSTLAQMIDRLAPLPLTFQPGTNWEYSVATDVLSRLVDLVFISFESSARFFPKKKAIALGNPIRQKRLDHAGGLVPRVGREVGLGRLDREPRSIEAGRRLEEQEPTLGARPGRLLAEQREGTAELGRERGSPAPDRECPQHDA